MVEAFGERLAELGGRLHETESLEDARAAARAIVGDETVCAWADEPLAGIAEREAPAAEAGMSVIVADVGVAETGAIAFAHGPGRPRADALLPSRQIALLAREDIVTTVAEALRRFTGTANGRAANVVFAAGPSRTADIEQRHIMGVHAPRELDVIVYGS